MLPNTNCIIRYNHIIKFWRQSVFGRAYLSAIDFASSLDHSFPAMFALCEFHKVIQPMHLPLGIMLKVDPRYRRLCVHFRGCTTGWTLLRHLQPAVQNPPVRLQSSHGMGNPDKLNFNPKLYVKYKFKPPLSFVGWVRMYVRP